MLWLVFQPPKGQKKYKKFPNRSKNNRHFFWNPLNLQPIWIHKSGQEKNNQNLNTKKSWSLKRKFAVWCSGGRVIVLGSDSLHQVTSLKWRYRQRQLLCAEQILSPGVKKSSPRSPLGSARVRSFSPPSAPDVSAQIAILIEMVQPASPELSRN